MTEIERILDRCSLVELRMLAQLGARLPRHLAVRVIKQDQAAWERLLEQERERDRPQNSRLAGRRAARVA